MSNHWHIAVWSPPSIIQKSEEALETLDALEEESDSDWENEKEGESLDKNVDNDEVSQHTAIVSPNARL